MCRLTEMKFAGVLADLETLKADTPDGSELYLLADIVGRLTRQIAADLQDLHARVEHLERFVRPDPPPLAIDPSEPDPRD